METNVGSYSRAVLQLSGLHSWPGFVALRIPGRSVIGSDESSAIRLPNAENVLPRHAILVLKKAGCRIRNLSPQGDTFLNGNKVEVAVQKHADCVRCGSVSLQILFEDVEPITLPVNVDCGMSSAHQFGLDQPPQIKGFAGLKRIGAGALGTVSLARRLGTDRQVAIKCIRPELESDKGLSRAPQSRISSATKRRAALQALPLPKSSTRWPAFSSRISELPS